MASEYQSPRTPKAYIFRRLHSILGLGLVLFLIEHLLTNSQATLSVGDDGRGFIDAVNFIHSLPYLHVIELLFIGVPLLIHGIWGIQYLFTSKINSTKGDGSKPSLPEYPRNHAYTWQRISSWILVFAIVAHVIQMRFVEQPLLAHSGSHEEYIVKLHADAGLYTLASRLGIELFDSAKLLKEEMRIVQARQNIKTPPVYPPPLKAGEVLWGNGAITDQTQRDKLLMEQSVAREEAWIAVLKQRPLLAGEVIASSDTFGKAILLVIRDTFKNPLMMLLYSVFVIMACFHAFNGLWTLCITWGVTLTYRSQQLALYATTFLMVALACLGLSCIWGVFWINLRY